MDGYLDCSISTCEYKEIVIKSKKLYQYRINKKKKSAESWLIFSKVLEKEVVNRLID